METYHRKRSKRSAINMNNEIMSSKRQDTSSVLDGGTPPSARQILLDTNYEVPDEEVELGSVYEIYHKNLPPRTPVQLRSTRVVMVSEKTELNVAIRYPSIVSLRAYFSNGITEMYPALDEKFVMGTKLARKVLLRQVPSQEFAEKKHLESFWLVNPNSQSGSNLVMRNEDIGLARELKKNMVRWGVRRQVTFIGKDKELSSTANTQSSSSFVQGEEEEVLKDEIEIKGDEYDQEKEEVDDEQDQEDNDDEAEEEDDEEEETLDANLERKLKSTRKLRKRKKAKKMNQLWQVNKKPMKKCKKLALRDPTDRWSKERYMAAELSLLEAMKEKKAMIGNPITRPALRIEARKRIGDTGLLDHLLKHVANKVAPGGTLRFRRSHNADGAMEYWLENADLLKIRKDAGVNDPFWTPPPGWKPGDSPIQDPIVAKEINHLKQEISTIKARVTSSQKLFDEELASLRREIQELTSKNKQDQSQAIVVSEQIDTTPKQVMDFSNFMLRSDSETTDEDNSLFSREKCKKQIVAISAFLKKIEAWMNSEVGKETTQKSTELINAATVSDEQKESEKLKMAEKNEVAGLPKEPACDQATSEESGRILAAADTPPAAAPPEGKAAKIERLKSGFRLCRPQGTFLWPNMMNHQHPSTTTTSSATISNMSSQVAFQVEDLLVVPTPPSVNSSTPPQLLYHHPHPHHHLSLVPERRPVTLTVSTVSTLPESHSQLSNSTTTTLINLNDIPTNPWTQLTVNTTTTNDEWEAEGVKGCKKRKSSPSSGSSAWIADSGLHQQWFNDANSSHDQ